MCCARTRAFPARARVPRRLRNIRVRCSIRSQVKDFIVDGYLVITPDGLPGGREQFASSFYSKARSIAGPDVVGNEYRSRDETLWEALTPEVNAVLSESAVHGALTSLLGPDFIGPPGNSLMHVSQPSDQMYAPLSLPASPSPSPSSTAHRCLKRTGLS